jgi:hypothetical protein
MRYLDQNGDASPPVGHAVVQTESEFLDRAFDTDIVVRGPKLCAWAEFFWEGRDMNYQTLHSPIQKLRIYVPLITHADAQEVLAINPAATQSILQAIDLRGILKALFPTDLWQPTASVHHGAHWLVWLDERNPPSCAQQLLKVQADLWQDQFDGAERHLYGATNGAQAREVLDRWLGIEEASGAIVEEEASGAIVDLPEFPLSISERLRQRVEETWTRRTVEYHGTYFRSIISRRIPYELKEEVAKMSAAYFKRNPSELSASIIHEMSDFLPMEEKEGLRDIVPPDIPPPLPETPSLVAAWFCDSYLPYRLWAIGRDDETVRSICRERGTTFAKWFLAFYPTALAAGDETISFRRSGRVMHDRSDSVTLMIILDGIGIWDAKELTRHIQGEQKRLVLTRNDWCFAAVPTVTEICKPAMRQGVAPRNVNPKAYALAADTVRLLENEDAALVLSGAKSNDFFIWSLIQTDQTYHKTGDARTIRDNIRAVLEGFSKRIASAVEAVPNHLKLDIIITTDHGRFLGRSERTMPILPGMTSHQRAAWGGPNNANDLKTDFEVLADGKAARLHPERYGLSQAAIVAIAEDSFVNTDGSRGADWFPHGGLWPEEVIIPWLEFRRDAEPPRVDGRISGAGVEGREGEIEIHLTNSSQLELQVHSVTIEGDGLTYQFPVGQKLPAKHAKAFTRQLSPWPSVSKVGRLSAQCILRQPTGDHITVKLDLSIASESLQKRHADLDDLL